MDSRVKTLHAREILDSRGNPTVELEVALAGGASGRAAVPSGATPYPAWGDRIWRRQQSYTGCMQLPNLRPLGSLATVTTLWVALICAPSTRAQSALSATPVSHDPLPSWAYPLIPPGSPINDPNEAADHTLHSVPDGAMALTMSQVHNRYKAPDWHPDGHPAMPTVVALGREPQVFACGYCHLPNGQGRPENSSLAGLPAGYIVEQLGEFRSGQRRSSEPRQQPIVTMSTVETQADAAEVQAAADYFASLKPRRWIKVVESATVPKTRVLGWMLVPISERETEPTGNRIIEVPQDTAQTELRNDASGFIAYVPPGSIQRGEALVNTGGAGTTIACAICHGPELRGLGNVPSIAGRSPSYIVRQLYDIQSGARHGLSVSLMQAVVAKLSVDDMVAIAAYTSSRDP